jgi:hypothetical protein
MPNKTDGQHALFVHIGIWRRAFMRENILSSVLDVCQNMFDSQFLGMMAGSQFGISCTPGALRERRIEFLSRPWMRRSDSSDLNPGCAGPFCLHHF